MAYDKISYPKIEEAVKFILDDSFTNVYVSPVFNMLGNECVRINLESSNSESLAINFEVRNYNLIIRYYTKANMANESDNEFVKNRIDKLKKTLIDNQVKNTSNNWAKLEVESITYNLQDDENEDKDNLFIAELDVLVTNYNQF
jgi:hypothetical protein